MRRTPSTTSLKTESPAATSYRLRPVRSLVPRFVIRANAALTFRTMSFASSTATPRGRLSSTSPMKALWRATVSNLASRLSAIVLKLLASVPTSSSVSTRARSFRFPSPSVEAAAARLCKGFVKRPTAHTASTHEAASVTAHAAASRSIERPAGDPSGAGMPTATLHPEGSARATHVTRLAPSPQRTCSTRSGRMSGASAAAPGLGRTV